MRYRNFPDFLPDFPVREFKSFRDRSVGGVTICKEVVDVASSLGEV